MNGQTSFTAFAKFGEIGAKLDEETRKEFYFVIAEYGFTGVVPKMSGLVDILFTAIKDDLDYTRANHAKRQAQARDNSGRFIKKSEQMNEEKDLKKPENAEIEQVVEITNESDAQNIQNPCSHRKSPYGEPYGYRTDAPYGHRLKQNNTRQNNTKQDKTDTSFNLQVEKTDTQPENETFQDVCALTQFSEIQNENPQPQTLSQESCAQNQPQTQPQANCTQPQNEQTPQGAPPVNETPLANSAQLQAQSASDTQPQTQGANAGGRVLEFLRIFNDETGKTYSTLPTPCANRLCATAHTEADVREMIRYKAHEWDNPKMRGFITPKTLFGDKFDSYVEEAKNAKAEVNKYDKYNR